MCPITVFGIQSVGRNEMCIHASDLTCFGIHHVGKSLYGTTDMFCNCYGRIIVTLKEQRVQKVFQIILLTFLKAEFYLRLRSCIGRYLYTEYGLEQVFNVIDSRYRSGKPLIVTTNLTLDDLRNPEDTAHSRIYDRLLSMCVPVRFTGENFRQETAQRKMESMKKLITD